jgi:hypothetical protein
MAYISIDFDLPLPNQFLVDHSQSQGNVKRMTYHGPDKLFLHIDKETGKEKYGPVTEDDIADGRPVPADCYLFEVDCTTDPLICQLRGPIINDLQVPRDTAELPHPQSPEISGYPQYKYCPDLIPDDVYNRWSCHIVDGKPVLDAWTVIQKLLDRDTDLTWDDIRQHRDTMLANSDAAIAEDMPEDLKNKWKSYRQKLRDLPTVMQANNVHPNIAYYMFPYVPGTEPEGYVDE